MIGTSNKIISLIKRQKGVQMKMVRITYKPSGMLLAEGPVGWGIMFFENNYYISKKHLKTDRFKVNFIPGLCFYKFLYVWMDLKLDDGTKVKNIGWFYWLPNPLFPFIWFRVAVPGSHSELEIEIFDSGVNQ